MDRFAATATAELERLAEECLERTAVLVITAAEARAAKWAEDIVVALAERIGKSRPVLLIDTIVDSGLPERLGADNLEGVADVLLFGASLKHVVQQISDPTFAFVPAGAAADFETQLADPRWRRLLSEAQSAEQLAVVHVDAAAPGLDHIGARVGACVAVGADTPDNIGGATVLALISAPAPVAPPPARLPAAPPPPAAPVQRELTRDEQFEAIRVPKNAAREALIADLRARQRAALMAPPPALEPLPGVGASTPAPAGRPAIRVTPSRPTPSLNEPSFAGARSAVLGGARGVKSRPLAFWALSLAVLVALGAGAWIMVRRSLQETAPASATPPAATPAPAAVPLPYSVAIEAHQQLPTAIERVTALRKDEPDIGFYIAPSLLDSVLYYRVMAGPMADSLTVGAVLRRLIERGHKTGTNPGDVRVTPMAFLIGEFDGRGDAQKRAEEALEASIPAYVVETPQPDGSRRWRVYAGAYAGQAEANVMRQLLKSTGLPDTLVQRIGARN